MLAVGTDYSIITPHGSRTSGAGTCSSSPPDRRSRSFRATRILMLTICRRNLQSCRHRISARSAPRRICCAGLRSCWVKQASLRFCSSPLRYRALLRRMLIRFFAVAICFWRTATGKMRTPILIECWISAPECGIAYLCRASVNWECKTLEMLQRKYENASDMAVSSNRDFAKAIRFADNSLKVTLEQWEQSRTANQKREKANAEHRYADAEAQYAATLKSWNAQCETIMQQREQALQLCRKNEETRLKESALQQRNRVIQEKDAIIAEQTAIKANAEKAIASLGALKFLEKSRKKSVIAQADEAICMAESEKQVAEAAYEESLTAISAVLTEAEQQFDEKIKADYPIPEEPEMSNDAFLYREKDYRIIYTCLCDMGRGLPHKLVDIQEHLSTGIQELVMFERLYIYTSVYK